MADHHHHDASISINGRSRGSSKAQLSLQKILQTISSCNQIQPPSIPHHQKSPASASSSSSSLTSSSSSVLINVPDEMMGRTVNPEKSSVGSSFYFDLNLSPPEEEEEEQIDDSDQTQHKESQSPVVNASDGGELQENDNERILEVGAEEEEKTDYSGQTRHQDSQFPVGNAGDDGGAIQEDNNERTSEAGPEEQKEDEDEEKNKRQRRLAALLDVVRIVSGDDGRSELVDPAELLSPVDNRSAATSATTDQGLTRNPPLHQECEEEEKGQKNAAEEEVLEEVLVAEEKVSTAVAEVAETAVARTKRGRAQVLPNKYRDSFVEPITTRSSRHNRSSSSSSSKHVPPKRRSTR